MSDRLAGLRAHAETSRPETYGAWVSVDDLLALVAVAEAAEEVVDHVDLGIEPPGWRELRAALARLVNRMAG